jgi:preprotein translocase subunit SecE
VARKRPGDDAAGDRPEDEVYEDAIAEGDVPDDDVDPDDELVSRGGTAVRERRTSSESPRAKRAVGRSGVFGRIGGFVREIIAELRKVIWPTRKELLTYTSVVIAFVAIMTAIVAVLDYGFAKAILFAFGN